MRPFTCSFRLAALVFGQVMFICIGEAERESNVKIQSIHDGNRGKNE